MYLLGNLKTKFIDCPRPSQGYILQGKHKGFCTQQMKSQSLGLQKTPVKPLGHSWGIGICKATWNKITKVMGNSTNQPTNWHLLWTSWNNNDLSWAHHLSKQLHQSKAENAKKHRSIWLPSGPKGLFWCHKCWLPGASSCCTERCDGLCEGCGCKPTTSRTPEVNDSKLADIF